MECTSWSSAEKRELGMRLSFACRVNRKNLESSLEEKNFRDSNCWHEQHSVGSAYIVSRYICICRQRQRSCEINIAIDFRNVIGGKAIRDCCLAGVWVLELPASFALLGARIVRFSSCEDESNDDDKQTENDARRHGNDEHQIKSLLVLCERWKSEKGNCESRDEWL